MIEPLASRLQRATDKLVRHLEFELEYVVAKREGRVQETVSPLGTVAVIFARNQDVVRAMRIAEENK